MRGLLCRSCGQKFPSRSSYVAHRDLHHPEAAGSEVARPPPVLKDEQQDVVMVYDDENDEEWKKRHDHIDSIITELNIHLYDESQKESLLKKDEGGEEEERERMELIEMITLDADDDDELLLLNENTEMDVMETSKTIKGEVSGAVNDDEVTVVSVQPMSEGRGKREAKGSVKEQSRRKKQQVLVAQQNYHATQGNGSFPKNYSTTQGNNLVMGISNDMITQNNYQLQNNQVMQRNHWDARNNSIMQQNYPPIQQNLLEINHSMHQSHGTMQQNHRVMYENNPDIGQIKSIVPSTIPSHYCEICKRTFFRKCDLKKHLKQYHTLPEESPIGAANNYQCKICMHRFLTSRDLSRHIAEYHGKAKRPDPHSRKVQPVDGDGRKPNQKRRTFDPMWPCPGEADFTPMSFQFSEVMPNHASIMNNAGLNYLNPNYVGEQKIRVVANDGNSPSSLQNSDSSSVVRLDAKYHQDVASYRLTPPQSHQGSSNLGQSQFNVNVTQNCMGEKGLPGRSVNRRTTTGTYNNTVTLANNFTPEYQFPSQTVPGSDRPSDLSAEGRLLPERGISGRGFSQATPALPAALTSASSRQQPQQYSNIPGGFPPDIVMRDANSINKKLLKEFSKMKVRPANSLPMQQNHSMNGHDAGKPVYLSQMDVSYFNKSQSLDRPLNSWKSIENVHVQHETFGLTHNNNFNTESQGYDANMILAANLPSSTFQTNGYIAPKAQNCYLQKMHQTNQSVYNVLSTTAQCSSKKIVNEEKNSGSSMQIQHNSPNERKYSSGSHSVVRPALSQFQTIQMQCGNSPASSNEEYLLHMPVSNDDQEKKSSLKRTHKRSPGKYSEYQKPILAKRQLLSQSFDDALQMDTHTMLNNLTEPHHDPHTKNVEDSSKINDVQNLYPTDLSSADLLFYGSFPQNQQQQPGVETFNTSLEQRNEQMLTSTATQGDERMEMKVEEGERNYKSPPTKYSLLHQPFNVSQFSPLHICKEPNLSKLKMLEDTSKSVSENVNTSTQYYGNFTSSVSSAVTNRLLPDEVKFTTSSEVKITSKYVVTEPEVKSDASEFKVPALSPLAVLKPILKDVELDTSRNKSSTSPLPPIPHPGPQYNTALGTMEQLSIHLANRTLPSSHNAMTVSSHCTMQPQPPPSLKRNLDTCQDGEQNGNTIPPDWVNPRTMPYIQNLRNKIYNQSQVISPKSARTVLKTERVFCDGQFSASIPNDSATPTKNIVTNHLFEQPSMSHAPSTGNPNMVQFLGNENLSSQANTLQYANNQTSFNYSVGPTNLETALQFPSREMARSSNMAPNRPAYAIQTQQRSPTLNPNGEYSQADNLAALTNTSVRSTPQKHAYPLPDVAAMDTTRFRALCDPARAKRLRSQGRTSYSPSYENTRLNATNQCRPDVVQFEHINPPPPYSSESSTDTRGLAPLVPFDHRTPYVAQQSSHNQAVESDFARIEILPSDMYRCTQCHQTFISSLMATEHLDEHNGVQRKGHVVQTPAPGSPQVTYAVPQETNMDQIIFEEFLIEQQPTLEETTWMELIQSIDCPPVKKRAIGRVNTPITLTPNNN